MEAMLTPAVGGGKATTILEAAGELFAQQGFDGVSINAVAQHAGVSKANVFHHFGSKDELYYAVLRNARSRLLGRLQDLAGSDSPLPLRLKEIVEAYLSNLFDNPRLARVLLRESMEHRPGRSKALAEKVFGDGFSQLVKLLVEAKQSGEIRQGVDPAAAVVMLVAGCVFFFQGQQMLRHYPEVDFADAPEQYLPHLVDILLNGIIAK